MQDELPFDEKVDKLLAAEVADREQLADDVDNDEGEKSDNEADVDDGNVDKGIRFASDDVIDDEEPFDLLLFECC